ncbi:MAG: hypothetical protein K2H85_10250, partial [Allobaculum sp.]|nr:hypothetical protein [Allobaculum sp.]
DLVDSLSGSSRKNQETVLDKFKNRYPIYLELIRCFIMLLLGLETKGVNYVIRDHIHLLHIWLNHAVPPSS